MAETNDTPPANRTKITADVLKDILARHLKWIYNEEGGIRANLAGANLEGANLAGANLTWANLAGANLSRANLERTSLAGAYLDGANLAGANLAWADLSWANLAGANLAGANLAGANLAWADLSWANLEGANLAGANLTWANLAGANLSRANLERTSLAGAYLDGANLAGANLDDDTTLDTGETWKEYREIVVPALLAAGGRAVEAGWVRKAWDCHDWHNCPMHEAFGIGSVDEGPILLRPRIKQFVQLFDARLLPCPFPDEAA